MTADQHSARIARAVATRGYDADLTRLDLNDLAARGYDVVDVTTSPHAPSGYGWHLTLDLRIGEDVSMIDDVEALELWVRGLIDAINMKAYGPTVVEHFGHGDPITSGYTVVQLIETSSITAHLSPHLRTAHVDVFSCRPFSPYRAVIFTEGALGGRGGYVLWQSRGVS